VLSSATPATPPPLQINGYDVDFALDVPGGLLLLQVELAATRALDAEKIFVLLTERARIDSISAKTAGSSIPLRFVRASDDNLQLIWPEELAEQEEVTIHFDYSIEIGEWFGNVMLLGRGHRWYPMIRDQIAPYRLQVRSFTTFEFLSGGNLVSAEITEDSAYQVWETEIAVFKIPLVIARAGHLSKNSIEAGGVKVEFHSPDTSLQIRKQIVEEVGDYLDYYEQLLGDYPHQSLILAEIVNYPSVNTSSGLIMLGEAAVSQYRQGDRSPLALAVANQWIGAGVFPQFGTEGFWFMMTSIPHYLRLMQIEAEQGHEAMAAELDQLLDRYKEFAGGPGDVALLDIVMPGSELERVVIYGKGPYIVHQVREIMGDKAWRAFLKDLYKQYLGELLTYQNLLTLLRKHDGSGKAADRLDQLCREVGLN
jgi:hypothetical protein